MQSIFGALKNSLQNSLVLSSIMKCLDGRSLLVLKVMLLKTVVFWSFFFLNLDFVLLWILKMQFVDTTGSKQGLTFMMR
jgi:hypothetical protein